MGSAVNIVGTNVKNYVINGQFDFYQRISIPDWQNNGNIYTADRWFRFKQTGGNPGVFSNISDAGLGNGVRSFKLGRTIGSSDTNQTEVIQALETRDSVELAGKRVTFSFLVRKGTGFSGSALNFYIGTGTGVDQGVVASWTGAQVFNGIPVLAGSMSTTTYLLVKQTFLLPSGISQVRFDFNYTPTGTSPGQDFVEITQVMLNIGDFAPYVRHDFTYQKEFKKCLRYFEKTYPLERGPGTAGSNGDGVLTARWPISPPTNNELIAHWRFSEPKRAIPIMTWYNPETGTVGEWRHDVPGNASAITHAGNTNQFGSAVTNGAATNTAFHRVHGTAEAEL